MNKITVFWIEDNPIISNEEEINGLKYPKLLHTNHFTYCLFQHPKQVEEYLYMISKLQVNGSLHSIAERCPAALPDIVVFDYKLYDAFRRNTNALQYSNTEHNEFLKKLSASHKIKDCYANFDGFQELFLDNEDVKNGNYMGDKFKHELKIDAIQPDDEFGLFCGVVIIREFKEYITCGVPATINKADKSTMSYNSLFYEWINSYDLKGAIGRLVADAENESKNWAHILNFAANLLRERIVTQVLSGRITLNLQQLIDYASGKIPTEEEKRIFAFQSVYGIRHLPLDGLFIDESKDERDEKIKDWTKDLIADLKTDEYKLAKEKSTFLIDGYKDKTTMDNRFRLSKLVVNLCNGETLSEAENEELNQLKEYFDINDSHIQDAKKDKSTDIQKRAIDYRDCKTKDNQINRLIVLFADLRLHLALQIFCEKNKNASDENGVLHLFKQKPGVNELRAVLYPVPKNPLVLPYHYHLLKDDSVFTKKDPFEVWEKPIGGHMGADAIFSKTEGEFPKGLSKGEVELCKSFALDKDIRLNENYFPEWLNKHKK